MSSPVPYIAIAIAALAVIVLLLALVWHPRQQRSMSPLASLAFALVIAGIVFSENRTVGYTLMGTGIALSLVDIAIRRRSAQRVR